MAATMTPNMNPLDPRAQQVASLAPAITQDPASDFESRPVLSAPVVDEAAPAPLPSPSALAVPVTVDSTQTQKTTYQPEDVQAIDTVAKQRLALLDDQTKIIEESTKAENALAENAIAKAETAQAAMVAEEVAFKAKSDRLQSEYQQAYKDYTSFKVDPNKFWNDKTTGDKIGMVLLAAIGSGAAGYSGRQGPDFSAMIDRAVNQDIEAQKMQMESLKGKADLASNQYAQAFSIYQNDLQAKLAVRAAGYEVIEARLNKNMGNIKNATALANAKLQKVEAAEKAALARAELNKELKTTQSETKVQAPAPEALKNAKEAYTVFGQAKSRDVAEKIDASTVQLRKVIRDTDRLNQLYDKVGTKEYIEAEAKGELKALQNAYIDHLRVAANAGTLGVTERDQFLKMLGSTWTRASEAKQFINSFKDSFTKGTTDLVNTGVPSMNKKINDSQLLAKMYYGEKNEQSAKYGGANTFTVQSDARNKNKSVAGR
jgi:hypothetical protein